jgi:hypothetical protein
VQESDRSSTGNALPGHNTAHGNCCTTREALLPITTNIFITRIIVIIPGNSCVPSDVILPREVLETIAQANPRQMDELAELMGDLPHRFEKFGPKIMRVLTP